MPSFSAPCFKTSRSVSSHTQIITQQLRCFKSTQKSEINLMQLSVEVGRLNDLVTNSSERSVSN